MKIDSGNAQAMRMLKMTQAMFFVNALVWLTFGVMGFLRAVAGDDGLRWVLSGLMVINAGVMLWFGLKIISGHAWIFFFAILYIALNVVLSIADQFGWYDFGILLLNLIILGLLFVTRRRLVRAKALQE